jgi:hypothetical protein
MEEEMCVLNSFTTNSILRMIKYFQTLTRRSKNVLTIVGCDATIVGSKRATITFPNGTQVTIEDALLYPDSTRTLISFRDIQKSGLHVFTHEVLERIPSTPSGLYYTYIKPIPHVAYKVIFQNVDTFMTWHSRLGHPGAGMMKKIIGTCTGHDLKDVKF